MRKTIDITPKEDRLPSSEVFNGNLLDEITRSFDRVNNLLKEQNETLTHMLNDICIVLDTEEIEYEEIN